MADDPAANDQAPSTGERALRDRLRVLRRLGFGGVQHDSHVPFLSHLVGTRRILADWGCRPALCDAGLFHSVYGTEYFTPTAPADRDEIVDVIGAEAEELAWLWCVIARDRIAPDRATVPDRNTGEVIQLGPERLADLATLWCADTVEQLARMAVHERGFAGGLRPVLRFATPDAQRAVEPMLVMIDEYLVSR